MSGIPFNSNLIPYLWRKYNEMVEERRRRDVMEKHDEILDSELEDYIGEDD